MENETFVILNFLNISLSLDSIIFEIIFYLGASIMGVLVRNLMDNKRFNFKKDLLFTIISTSILFCISNLIKSRFDERMLFLICTGVAALLPKILSSKGKWKILARIVGVFHKDVGDALMKSFEQIDGEEKEEKEANEKQAIVEKKEWDGIERRKNRDSVDIRERSNDNEINQRRQDNDEISLKKDEL